MDKKCKQITKEFFAQKTNYNIYLTRKECVDTLNAFHAHVLKRLKEEKLITSKKQLEYDFAEIMEDIDISANGFPARVEIGIESFYYGDDHDNDDDFYATQCFIYANVNGTLNDSTRSVLESLANPGNKKTFLADLLKVMAQSNTPEYLFDERPYMRTLAKVALNNKGD